MKHVLMLLALISLASAPRATAETPPDAPRLLAEALRSGSTDVASIATIVRWVLEEKEENVASGFAAALSAVVGDVPDGTVDPRWSEAARGAIAAFEGLLRDAQTFRRRDGESVLRDLEPVFRAAAPAVADALRETDPEIAEGVLRALRSLSPPPPAR